MKGRKVVMKVRKKPLFVEFQLEISTCKIIFPCMTWEKRNGWFACHETMALVHEFFMYEIFLLLPLQQKNLVYF
jgi:hypothetical protein